MTHVCYILDCEHVMPGRPNELELYCYTCKEKHKVTDVHLFEWRSHCLTCNNTRYSGLSQQMSRQAASKHSMSSPHHRVQVEYVKNPASVEVRDKMVKNGLIT